MTDHQIISAERGRRAADLRAAAVALLEQQAIAAGVMLDLDSDQVVAAGPKSAILYLLSNGAPAATSGDAPDLQQLKALALAVEDARTSDSEDVAYEALRDFLTARRVLGLIAQVESLYNAMRLWKQKAEGAARIESAAAPAPVGTKEFRDAIRNAVITCGHKIEDGAVTLFHNPKFPGNAFSQLIDRIELAAAPGSATASGDELPSIDTPEFAHLLCELFTAKSGSPSNDARAALVAYIDAQARAAVSAATKPTADAESAWTHYIVQRTQLMDTGRNRSIFVGGYSAAAAKPTADLSVEGVDFHNLLRACMIHSDDYPTRSARLIAYIKQWGASLLATKPAAPVVPEGFVLMPKEPTVEQLQAKLTFDASGCQMGEIYRAMLAATPAASTTGAAQTAEQVRDQVRDAVAEALSGTYYCNRVWSAWGVGTMSEDDFAPANEDDNILDNVVDSVLKVLRPTPTHSSEAGDA